MAKKKLLPSILNSGQGAPVAGNIPIVATDPLNPANDYPFQPVQPAVPKLPVDVNSLTQQMLAHHAATSAPAEVAATAAEAAPEATSLLSRLKPEFGGKKAFGKGAVLATIGDVAAPWAGKLASHFLGDQVGTDVQDAITGASTAGGIGSMFGPEVGIPAAIIGAIGGGLYGQFHHDNKQSVGDQVMGQLTAFGVDPNLAQRVVNKYNTLAKGDKTAATDWLAGQVGAAQSQFSKNNDLIGGTSGSGNPEQNLVLQQLAGQAMAPYVNDMRQNLDASSNALKMSMGKNLTPEQSMRMAPLVTQYANLSKNVADAYALQAEQFPIENQLAKSAWATMLQASQGSGGGGLTNLLAQTTPSVPNANSYSATT